MEPTLLLIGILTSAAVVYLAIRLGWLRNGWARVAVAWWIMLVVMLACLPLCAALPGSFVTAVATGWLIAWVATLVYHRAALEFAAYPLELPPGVFPRATARRMGATWTPAQNVGAARVQAGMGKKKYVVEELP